MHLVRFDPDGQCLQMALDYIFSYFETLQSSQDIITYSSNYKALFKFLTEKKYLFIISIPFGSLFFSHFWVLFFRFFGHFVTPRKYAYIKNRLSNANAKHIVFGEDTAKRLYGLNGEYWSHFIVFYRDIKKKSLEIFDPLKPILEKKMGHQIEQCCEADRLLLKILIWRDA